MSSRGGLWAADIGNSRLKLGRLDASGAVLEMRATSLTDAREWDAALDAWGATGAGARWALGSVRPETERAFSAHLRARGVSADRIRVVRSAADVPGVGAALGMAGATGADRALGVLAALGRHDFRGPGAVVSCGTAITVERIDGNGVWRGGGIAPGPRVLASALASMTAQLPDSVWSGAEDAPASWGDSTVPAMRAGLFWGAVGMIRELLARQRVEGEPPRWLVWTGGDAELFARWVECDADAGSATIAPELVLSGLGMLMTRAKASAGEGGG